MAADHPDATTIEALLEVADTMITEADHLHETTTAAEAVTQLQ